MYQIPLLLQSIQTSQLLVYFFRLLVVYAYDRLTTKTSCMNSALMITVNTKKNSKLKEDVYIVSLGLKKLCWVLLCTGQYYYYFCCFYLGINNPFTIMWSQRLKLILTSIKTWTVQLDGFCFGPRLSEFSCSWAQALLMMAINFLLKFVED